MSRYVEFVTWVEEITYRQSLSSFVARHIVKTKLCDATPWSRASFLKVTSLGFRDALVGCFTETDLYGIVAVI